MGGVYSRVEVPSLQDIIDQITTFGRESLLGPFLYLVVGAGFGVFWADVVWSLRPFAKRRVSTTGVLLSLLAGAVGIAFLTVRISDGIATSELAALTVATAVGALILTAGVRAERDPRLGLASPNLLTDAEVERTKEESEIWMLVTGAPSCGKSALIEAMLRAVADAPTGHGAWRALGAPRTQEGAGWLMVETDLRSTDGGVLRSRIVETSRMDLIPTRNGLADMDVIVLMLDPTQLEGLGDTFPGGIRPRDPVAEDGNRVVQHLVTMLGHAEGEHPVVWAVIPKADLLRFSVAPPLVAFPVAVGPGWWDQMSRMSLPQRRQLSTAMGLTQLLQEHVSFTWGGGNPMIICERGGDRASEGFGGDRLLSAILDTVA